MCHKDIVASAIVSNLARSAPFLNISHQEANQNIIDSWEKEIAATTGPDRPQVLNYDVWFSDLSNAHKMPLSEHVPPAPVHNARIRAAFRQWKDKMAGRLLFPQIQANKTISRGSSALFTDFIHQGNLPARTDTTSSDLEKLYADSGVEIGGPCELRQSWKYNEITPRTYCSQGGKAFHSSKYMRVPINELTNVFPEVNFLSRFSIHELPLETMDDAFVYDYISFTSLFAELKYFLEELANFCEDTEVFLVDSRLGIIRTTLGAVIRDYNETCNIKGEFTINRYTPGENIPMVHEVAGFLGVYANIASCTTLHGLHACQICGDQSNCRCVGDDVFGILGLSRDWSRDDALKAVESLGRLQREKVQWWSYVEPDEENMEVDHAYTYLKRPLDRFGNRMFLDRSLYLPIWGLIHPIEDIIQREEEDLQTRVKLLATQTYGAIKQAQSLNPPLELHQQDFLQIYFRSLYEYLGLDCKGRLPFEKSKVRGEEVSGLFIPNIEERFLELDPWDVIASRWVENQTVRLPEMVREYEDLTSRLFLQPGDTLIMPISKIVAYLRDMGWATCKARSSDRYVEFDEYRNFYVSLFGGELHALYDVKLVEWHRDVIKDLSLM